MAANMLVGLTRIAAPLAGVLLAVGLSGCSSDVSTPTSTSSTPAPYLTIDGIYKSPSHDRAGTFAGLRAVVSGIGSAAFTDLFLIGSDDGDVFYMLNGAFDKDGEGFRVDFSPKDGSNDLIGTYGNGVITWEDNNTWTQMPDQACAESSNLSSQAQSAKMAQSAKTAIGGVFMSSTSRGWDGVRFVTNSFGSKVTDQLLVIGSEDGKAFWFQYGTLNEEGTGVTFDFSASGGRASVICDVEPLRISCPADSDFGSDWVKAAGPCGSVALDIEHSAMV